MFEKILLAINEQNTNSESVKFVERYANTFGSGVQLVSVIPDFENFSHALGDEEKNKITEWVNNTLVPESKTRLDEINDFLKQKGIESEILITQGVPSQEIVQAAIDSESDLIVMDKGREHSENLLGGTALKVLRNTIVPVLTFNSSARLREISKVLVPIDLYHVIMKFSLKYLTAFISSLAESLDARITKLYVVETGNHRLPEDLISKIKEDSLRSISSIGYIGFTSDVEVSTAAWTGIVDFAREKDMDLIVISRYMGRDFRPKFLGSTAEKVIQEAHCPVITLNP